MSHKRDEKRHFESFLAGREAERGDFFAPLKKLKGRKVQMTNSQKGASVLLNVTRAQKETNMTTGAAEVVIYYKNEGDAKEMRLPLPRPDDLIDFISEDGLSGDITLDYQQKDRPMEDAQFFEKMRRTNDHGNTVWTKKEVQRSPYTVEFKIVG